jgi:MerR-like DNA binding protein
MSQTLEEKQEEMRQRRLRQQAIPAVKENFLLPLVQPVDEAVNEEKSREKCIFCKRRWARLGQVYCSRCSGKDHVNNLRDVLPGLLVPPQDELEGITRPDRSISVVHVPIKEVKLEIDMPTLEVESETITSLDGQKVYTRKQASKMVGVSSTTLCRWENKGKIPQPRRLVHSKQVLYTEELIAIAKEYMSQEYIPPASVSPTPSTPTGRLPFAIKKGMKVNRRLERAVANRIGAGRSTL